MATKTVKLSKTTRRLVWQENFAAYMFLLPFLIFFVGFVLYPMFMCVYTSFFDANMGKEDVFIGFMSVMAMLLTCLTSAMAGYALAKKRFYGRTLLFSLIVCAMALPKQVILIPLLREMNALGLHDTVWSVIFPVVGWPFGAMPELYIRIFDLVRENRIAEARAIQDECLKIIQNLCACKGNMYAVIKAVLRKMGAPDCGGVRAPLYNLVPEDEAQVDKCVALIRAAYEKFL